MVDYINTEIVEYADSDYHVGALGYYPATLSVSYVRVDEVDITSPWYVPEVVPDLEVEKLVDLGLISEDLVETPLIDFYWLGCVRDMDGKYPAVESYQLYYVKGSAGLSDYTRVNVYVYELVDYYHPELSGDDIYWFYNFGEYIFLQLDNISGLLGIDINGYNLLYVMLGSGFIVYATWCVIKWFIPL